MSSSSGLHPANERVGRDLGCVADRHQGLMRPDLAGRAPGRLEQRPQQRDLVARADDRRAAATLAARLFDESTAGIGGRPDRHQVGARVAQRCEPTTGDEAPHLGTQPPRIKPSALDAGTDEHVRYGVAVQQVPDRIELTIVENPYGRTTQHELPSLLTSAR